MARATDNQETGMGFELTDAQEEFRAECRRFAAEVIRPVAAKHDREESTPWDILREARAAGLDGPILWQRLGSDPLYPVIHAEEIHWGCAGIALAIAGTGLAVMGLFSAGTPEQIAWWLPELTGDEDNLRIGAYAVTEPGAGSDVRSLKTTARRDGDEWVLNGTKCFITNGGVADAVVVVATVDPSLGHRGQASFVVPYGTPGFHRGKKEQKLGIRASDTSELVFEDCRLPLENLLGGEERLEARLARGRRGERASSSNALATFERTRPLVGAGAVGIARAAYEWTLEYLDCEPLESDDLAETLDAGSSSAGRARGERQRIEQVLAQVATEIDAARLLVHRGASMTTLSGGEGSMAKLKAADVAMWATTTCMDLVGPAARDRDCPLEKWFRDAKVFQIFEGTAQIQRLVIARLQRESDRRSRLVAAEGDRSQPAEAVT